MAEKATPIRKADFDFNLEEQGLEKVRKPPFVVRIGTTDVEMRNLEDLPMEELIDLIRLGVAGIPAMLYRVSEDGGRALKDSRASSNMMGRMFKAYQRHYDIDLNNIAGTTPNAENDFTR